MKAPCRYLITTSPGGACWSGLGALGLGVHLFAIPATVLRQESRIVASRDMPSIVAVSDLLK